MRYLVSLGRKTRKKEKREREKTKHNKLKYAH